MQIKTDSINDFTVKSTGKNSQKMTINTILSCLVTHRLLHWFHIKFPNVKRYVLINRENSIMTVMRILDHHFPNTPTALYLPRTNSTWSASSRAKVSELGQRARHDDDDVRPLAFTMFSNFKTIVRASRARARPNHLSSSCIAIVNLSV